MTALPAYCPSCTAIFPSGFDVRPGATGGVSNVATNCPVCGFQNAKISDGVYRATEDAIELISGPESTREILETLKRLAEKVSSGEIDHARAAQEAKALPPKYAALLDVFAKIGGSPALMLLIQIITVYLQYEGNKSSSEDAKKLLEAVTQQTFAIQQLYQSGVGTKSGAPSDKEHNQKPSCPKHPSGGRADVNNHRRAALKKFREAFGQSRTR